MALGKDELIVFFGELLRASKILNRKIIVFFSDWIYDLPTQSLSRGQLSKGKLNFFDYSLENLQHLGILEKNLSKMRIAIETSWYSLLQLYGKLLIKPAKES